MLACPDNLSYHEKADRFIGDFSGQTFQLNEDGLCVLEYQDMIVVVDVPSDHSSFYMYLTLVKEIDPSEEVEILKRNRLCS